MISSIGQNQSATAFRAKNPGKDISFVPSLGRALMNPEELSADVFQSNKKASGQFFSAVDTLKSRLEEFRDPSFKHETVKFQKPLGEDVPKSIDSKPSLALKEKARNYFDNLDDVMNGFSSESSDKNYN